MNHVFATVLLSCVALPLSAQRPEKVDPEPAALRELQLHVDQDSRHAALISTDGSAFFGFIVGSTKESTVRLAGFDLLAFEAVVATELAKDGKMELDLGKGGWGFDVYLQGVGLFAGDEVMVSNIAIVTDPKPEPVKAE